ncbi:MAG: helix-hairpin-helix domain-containing protein [Smithella sp.]|nr:helix-hairpin-helix domain-containing protein [Smithella sp.]
MKWYEHQIRGVIALGVVLALIPPILFLAPSLISPEDPPLSESGAQTLAVELVNPKGISGIFFVTPDESLHSLCVRLGFPAPEGKDIALQNGMRVRWTPDPDGRSVSIEDMDAATRLALGLPVDINLAASDDLRMIPGVGKKLAADIAALRKQKGRFEKLDQLMEVKGIKESKLAKLRPYLFIDSRPEL